MATFTLNDYQPVTRRPIAEVLRKTTHVAVRICMRWDIHPDVITYLSVAASAAAGFCFWKAQVDLNLLMAAPALCFLRGWFNILDGMVALASGKASRRGEFLQELADRFSDVIIFIGIAHSGLATVSGGYLAAIFALLTAYVSALGQGVGMSRDFGGIMSKPWRIVTLNVGAWVTLAIFRWGDGDIHYAGWSVMDWAIFIIIVGCLQTLWIRVLRNMRGLREMANISVEG